MRGSSVALLVFVVALVATGHAFAWQAARAGTTSFWLLAMGPTVALAIVAAVRGWRDGDLFEWLRPRWGDATYGVLSGIALLVGAWGFARVVAPPGSPREVWLARIYLQLGDPGVLAAHVPLVATVIIVAALAEELVWRGMVTSLLAERVGSRRAWMFATLLFGVAHLPAAWALRDASNALDPLLPLAALGAGGVWAAIARHKGRLVPAIISHALFDWCVLMMFRLWGNSI